MIEVRDLCKNYGDRRAIDRLNFNVKKGEVVGFLGPNGAGKSTTMKIITGFMAPTSGEVKVNGFDVFEDPIEVKQRIGYLPETPPVYGEMYVKDYLTFVAKLRRTPKDKIEAYVKDALEKTNLGHVQNRLIQNLSKGFRQRVGLAQALVSKPDILILDEPTVGLDPKQMSEIRQLILNLRGEHTIILSTHILPEVQAVCERIIIINDGRIVAQDSLEGLSQRMTVGHHLAIKVRRGAAELAAVIKSIPGVRNVKTEGLTLLVDIEGAEDLMENIAAQVVNKGAGLLEFKTMDMGLEDIFIKLTTSTVNGKQKDAGVAI